MTDRPEVRLAAYARSRHGVFTREVARRLGFTDRQIRYRIATGEWAALPGGGLMLAACPVTFEARLAGAVLSVPTAAAAFESAGRMLAVRGVVSEEPVIVVRRGGNHRRPGVRIHESSDLRDRDIQRVWGIDVTSRERTLCDLGRVLSDGDLVAAFDDQLHRGLVTLDGLYGFFYRYARRGRPGVARVRRLLEAYEPGFVVPESVLERRTLDLIRSSGLPVPDAQVPLMFWDDLLGRVDFAYLAERIVIEVDGRRFHGPEVFESDRERDNAAGLAGWRVLRFTWAMVTERPDYVIATIAEALAQARRRAA